MHEVHVAVRVNLADTFSITLYLPRRESVEVIVEPTRNWNFTVASMARSAEGRLISYCRLLVYVASSLGIACAGTSHQHFHDGLSF